MNPVFLASRPLNIARPHVWDATPQIAVTAPILAASMPLYRGDAS